MGKNMNPFDGYTAGGPVRPRAVSASSVVCACLRTRKPFGPYDIGVLRSLPVLPALVALSFFGVCSAGVTNASPSEGAGSESCSFVLTPPQVVQASTTRMVLAAVKPGPCPMDAIPNESVVCLSIRGGDSQGQCAHRAGSDPALIYYPYRPGATYIVTGQGCADVVEDPVTHVTTGPVKKICQSIGPTSFTL